MRPRLALLAAVLVALAWLVGSTPFWLPRYLDIGGTSTIATAWAFGTLGFALAGVALAMASLMLRSHEEGGRGARWTVSWATTAILMGAPLLVISVLLFTSELHV